MNKQSPTVLVIDDDPHIRDMLEKNLILSGYNVLLAQNGLEGLNRLETHKPEIILLDLNMPVLGGVAFLKQIGTSINKTSSIIVLTGYATDNDIQECYQLGIQSFLRKPVNWYELEGLIKRDLELLAYSEQMKQEIAQKEQINLLLRNIFEAMAEGVIALDQQFQIKMISKKACRILGLDEKKTLNRSITSILGPNIGGPSGLILTTEKGKELADINTEFILPSGRILPVNLTLKTLENSTLNLDRLLLFKDLRVEQQLLRANAGGIIFGGMISANQNMKKVFALIENTAPSNATILIEGESGTGKELVAREIHTRSNRAQHPLIIVNCAAIPPNLLEDEFFGHEKGAFTSADKVKKGRFEIAHRGTLFLDEIAEIPLELQVKLLRALQEQEFERVGGNKTIGVDVRIIAATNQNLLQMVQDQKFREDLFYRLDVVKIFLPPLKERMSDIPLLVSHFIETLNQKENRQIKDVSAQAFQLLFAYPWPGNVRELYHTIEHAFAVSNDDIIQKTHLPEKLKIFQIEQWKTPSNPKSEQETILLALEQSSFHKGKAAAMLNISYVTLYRKIKKYKMTI